MKARLVKINQPSKLKYQVKSVTVDKKYGYFIITTKIYHHDIVETVSFNDCDYIELYDDKSAVYGMFSGIKGDHPIKVIRGE